MTMTKGQTPPSSFDYCLDLIDAPRGTDGRITVRKLRVPVRVTFFLGMGVVRGVLRREDGEVAVLEINDELEVQSSLSG